MSSLPKGHKASQGSTDVRDEHNNFRISGKLSTRGDTRYVAKLIQWVQVGMMLN
jgi:hypothetical protein